MTAREYLSRIHQLNCVVCTQMGMRQTDGTEAHHVESIRDEDSDYGAVALCVDHHRGKNGVHGLGRRGFVSRYKLSDIDLVALTIKAYLKEFA